MKDKKIKVYKGCHYSNEWPLSFICHSKDKTRKESGIYLFTKSCRYMIGADQTDKNKLFGWSYGIHHKNSVRCGWYYDIENDSIKLCLYVYDDGKVVKKEIAKGFNIGTYVEIRLEAKSDDNGVLEYCLTAATVGNYQRHQATYVVENKEGLPKWGYKLKVYFGGNRTAPHTIEIDKVP